MRATSLLQLGFILKGVDGFISPTTPRRYSVQSLASEVPHSSSSRSRKVKLNSQPPNGMPEYYERPDPAILIASKPGPEQQDAVFAISAALVIGSIVMVQLLSGLETILPNGWFAAWRDYTWPVGLGAIFTAAGVSHFTMTNAFCNIVPYYGCWGGLWKVPYPEFLGLTYEEFHTYWTGVAEIFGGLFLIASGIGIIDVSPTVPAALLGSLVVAITPANIFMFTHDAEMGEGIPPIPYPWGHVGRGIAQMVLVAMFWKLTFPY